MRLSEKVEDMHGNKTENYISRYLCDCFEDVNAKNACFSTGLYHDSPNIDYAVNQLTNILQDESHHIVRYAWILRDKDCFTDAYVAGYHEYDTEFIWPSKKFVDVSSDEIDAGIYPVVLPGEQIPPHFDVIVWFAPYSWVSRKDIGKWFNIHENDMYMNLPELSEHFMIKNLVNSYYPGKHQYDVSEIHSNFDVASIVNEVNEDYLRLVITAILQGDITKERKKLQIEPLTLKQFGPLINAVFRLRDKQEAEISQFFN